MYSYELHMEDLRTKWLYERKPSKSNILSRELRAEVEALKEMLLHAAQPGVLKEKLSENEKLVEVRTLYQYDNNNKHYLS